MNVKDEEGEDLLEDEKNNQVDRGEDSNNKNNKKIYSERDCEVADVVEEDLDKELNGQESEINHNDREESTQNNSAVVNEEHEDAQMSAAVSPKWQSDALTELEDALKLTRLFFGVPSDDVYEKKEDSEKEKSEMTEIEQRIVEKSKSLHSMLQIHLRMEDDEATFAEYKRAAALGRQQAENALKELTRERAREREELVKRERWKTEIGARLAALQKEVQTLRGINQQKHREAEHARAEANQWKSRCESAYAERDLLSMRAEYAVQLSAELEAERSRSSATLERLASALRDLDIERNRNANATSNKAASSEASEAFQELLMKQMRAQIARSDEVTKKLRSRIQEEERKRLRLESDLQQLTSDADVLRHQLEYQHEVYAAREAALEERYETVKNVNASMSAWITDPENQILDPNTDPDTFLQ
mmetsp:Transcript_7263/g.13105  ORF Transcript_7263/g.13105 Transcript_7263/m.13105 type:complete len:421 (-) Transcript_7263:100-1362(-)|eukprot:CAMPEP_0182443180 /NCGR_PEP_ID=MMETSP1172-20130603/1972_1 /TAXON_ID=708627 /ORGANISM="Timspurckia oligopyrenoides, Strain CCMP3278" /LENGTH=420 /DNA_ID=CAMNT_0024638359 /DNA_START=1083 /DNA_END=2345 /DNA_ORIENTATION=+